MSHFSIATGILPTLPLHHIICIDSHWIMDIVLVHWISFPLSAWRLPRIVHMQNFRVPTQHVSDDSHAILFWTNCSGTTTILTRAFYPNQPYCAIFCRWNLQLSEFGNINSYPRRVSKPAILRNNMMLLTFVIVRVGEHISTEGNVTTIDVLWLRLLQLLPWILSKWI